MSGYPTQVSYGRMRTCQNWLQCKIYIIELSLTLSNHDSFQGGYPQGGYPGAPRAQGGYPGAPPPAQGGYPGAPPPQGGYPGAPPPRQGGYPGAPPPAQGGYPGAPPPAQGGYPGAPPPNQGGYPGAQPAVAPQIQQWFNAVDQDRSGQITAQELQKALVNGNWSNFSEEACRLMIGKSFMGDIYWYLPCY